MVSAWEKLYSYCCGIVDFTVHNGFFGVFISECKKNGIRLYDVASESDYLKARTRKKYLKRLYDASNASGVDLRIVRKCGLPFVLNRLGQRFGVPVGMGVFLLLFFYLSSVLWSVEVTGAEMTDPYTVKKVIEECGLYVGSPLKKVNPEDAELMLNMLSPNISHTTVSVVGNRAYVNISEREYIERKDKRKLYSDIFAEKDGTILKADIFEGTGVELQQREVKKGDLLVSGIVRMNNNSVRYVDSKAQITAMTENNVSVRSAKQLYTDVINDKKDSYSFCIFNLTVPLTQRAKGNKLENNNSMLNTSDSVFPVGIRRDTVLQTVKSDIFLDNASAYLVCANDFANELYNKYDFSEIRCIGERFDYNDEVIIEGKIVCEEDICTKEYYEKPDLEK